MTEASHSRRRAARLIAVLALVVVIIYAGIFVEKVRSRHLMEWLPSYVAWSRQHQDVKPTDVMIMVADHWEPGNRPERVAAWENDYPKLFGNIKDDDGKAPQHTFFYPAEQFRAEQLEALVRIAQAGYGEIELHLHHKNDSSESLRKKIQTAKEQFGKFGALETPDGKPAFGFVHGNWTLDNAGGTSEKNSCGVDDEITILMQEGSFADYTFPAYGNVAQPRTIQEIYYVTDDPQKPKSYDQGAEMKVGGTQPANSYLLFEGPIAIRWTDLRNHFWPMIDYSQFEGDTPPDLSRFESWVRVGVHVEGRPEWVFIKNHTHGASNKDMPVVLSQNMAKFYEDIVTYCKREGIRLHFVTAREMYNIAKAAEAGKTGNPNQYRDYIIPAYRYHSVALAPAASTTSR